MQSSTFYLKMFGEVGEKPENPLACALRELSEPDPRMAEAVGRMFSQVEFLGEVDLDAADPTAVRRVGYLLERFGKAPVECLAELKTHAGSLDEPVFFTHSMTESRSERLRRNADDLQLKWGVFGELELRAS
jgi:hypothetical protein